MSSTRIVGWDLPKTSLGVPKFDMSNAAAIVSGPLKARTDISLSTTEQFVRCQSSGALMMQPFSSSRALLQQSGASITNWTAGAYTDNIDLDTLGANSLNSFIQASGLLAADSGPIEVYGVDNGNYYLLETVQKTQSGAAFYWKIKLKNVPFRYIAYRNGSAKTLTVDIGTYLAY
jgi:hypothetical protein